MKPRETILVGNYLVSYPTATTVAIARRCCITNISSQLLIHQQLDSLMTPTGKFCDITDGQYLYTAIIFRKPIFWSRRKIENTLKQLC